MNIALLALRVDLKFLQKLRTVDASINYVVNVPETLSAKSEKNEDFFFSSTELERYFNKGIWNKEIRLLENNDSSDDDKIQY